MRFEWSLKLRWQRLKAYTANCRINNQPNELPNFPPLDVIHPPPNFTPRALLALPLPNKNKAYFNLSNRMDLAMHYSMAQKYL